MKVKQTNIHTEKRKNDTIRYRNNNLTYEDDI